ncbi:hypothetical protein FRX31_008789 [Thalictrum thalictroides]|uniref:Uncharacterized protein n=1 Tax=Thalictrum thalictroides TaxID=46969 RepID=A0A7J6WW23_THATH|nr:hypothetical protein FRX31_008789 [Thalictrum thalictroides]
MYKILDKGGLDDVRLEQFNDLAWVIDDLQKDLKRQIESITGRTFASQLIERIVEIEAAETIDDVVPRQSLVMVMNPPVGQQPPPNSYYDGDGFVMVLDGDHSFSHGVQLFPFVKDTS